MALNLTELRLISDLIHEVKSNSGKVSILSLGYPDLLVTREQMSELIVEEILDSLPIRADSDVLAKGHGFDVLRKGVYETKSVFSQLGAEITCLDFRKTVGSEIVVDLNEAIDDSLRSRFDIIVDPGTLEHVFNVAQGIKNVVLMLKVGGYIYHQNPLCFINHGFYSFSPTFYKDFYEKNGFSLERLCSFYKGEEHHSFAPESRDFPQDNTYISPHERITGSILVKKQKELEVKWPIQRIYGGP